MDTRMSDLPPGVGRVDMLYQMTLSTSRFIWSADTEAGLVREIGLRHTFDGLEELVEQPLETHGEQRPLLLSAVGAREALDVADVRVDRRPDAQALGQRPRRRVE